MATQPSNPQRPPDVSVLIVDDDDESRAAMVSWVKAFGVRARGARDGIEALALLTEVEPDLVLCDINMPRLDGLGFVRQLRRTRQFRSVLTVAVTGLSGPLDVAATRDAGFDAHVVKPLSAETIARLLDRAVDARRVRPPQGA